MYQQAHPRPIRPLPIRQHETRDHARCPGPEGYQCMVLCRARCVSSRVGAVQRGWGQPLDTLTAMAGCGHFPVQFAVTLRRLLGAYRRARASSSSRRAVSKPASASERASCKHGASGSPCESSLHHRMQQRLLRISNR
jgi:hypothetical protein